MVAGNASTNLNQHVLVVKRRRNHSISDGVQERTGLYLLVWYHFAPYLTTPALRHIHPFSLSHVLFVV